MSNYAFFIGGSGARAYRAFLHAAAMGILRTEQVSVMRIDADNCNRAHSDCNMLYKMYQNMNQMTEGKEIFRCNITSVCEEIISPVQSNVSSLRKLVGEGNENRIRMLNALYTEEEQKQDLKGGFYSRPNIGCIFFANLESEELDACMEQIGKQLSNGEMVNIVLVGSIFGGTGASGIPALYKLICLKLKDNRYYENLNIGGVFLTPYFQVQERKNQSNQENIPICMDQFYLNTYQALSYYSAVIDYSRNTKFTGIYLVGQQELDIVNENYVDSGEKQDNKAHIVEFYAALAIDSYFSDPQKKGVFGYIRNAKVGWKDFPDMDRDNEDSRKIRKLADFAGMQVFLLCEIYPNIYIPEHAFLRQHPAWYSRYKLKNYCTQLKQMEDYSKTFIQWLYEINSRCLAGGLELDKNIALFRDGVLEQVHKVATEISVDGPMQEPVRSHVRDIFDNFNTLIDTVSNTGYVMRSARKITHLLSGGAAGSGAVGLILKILSCITQAE